MMFAMRPIFRRHLISESSGVHKPQGTGGNETPALFFALPVPGNSRGYLAVLCWVPSQVRSCPLQGAQLLFQVRR
jgi:hypothetical protein